jgi:hypothetical protein
VILAVLAAIDKLMFGGAYMRLARQVVDAFLRHVL